MANWIKFDGSEEQLQSFSNKESLLKMRNGEVLNSLMMPPYLRPYGPSIESFLICEPHPHREMIIEWANTGRPVYFKNKETGKWELTGENPGWYGDYEYSFDPPKEKIRYRVALMSGGEGAYTCTFHSESQNKTLDFVKWLTDWQEVEIDG